MKRAIVTDHSYTSLESERRILEAAGFALDEIQPICKTEDDIIRTCAEADALLVQWAPVTRKVLEALPKVKCIVRYGVGVNNFDLEAAKALGVCACNVPDYCVDEVSTHTLGMILALARRMPHDTNNIRSGGYGMAKLIPFDSLQGQKLGLVSFGRIAREVARKARVFGLQVQAYDPFIPDSVFAESNASRVDLETLITTSDIISLHCPLVRETSHLINRESIARMKDHAMIVNTSRGPVIEEPALIEALRSGKLSGAALDVYEVEPLAADSPLRQLDNVLLTSHSASYTEQSMRLLQTKAGEAVRDFFQGKRPTTALVWPGE